MKQCDPKQAYSISANEHCSMCRHISVALTINASIIRNHHPGGHHKHIMCQLSSAVQLLSCALTHDHRIVRVPVRLCCQQTTEGPANKLQDTETVSTWPHWLSQVSGIFKAETVLIEPESVTQVSHHRVWPQAWTPTQCAKHKLQILILVPVYGVLYARSYVRHTGLTGRVTSNIVCTH